MPSALIPQQTMRNGPLVVVSTSRCFGQREQSQSFYLTTPKRSVLLQIHDEFPPGERATTFKARTPFFLFGTIHLHFFTPSPYVIQPPPTSSVAATPTVWTNSMLSVSAQEHRETAFVRGDVGRYLISARRDADCYNISQKIDNRFLHVSRYLAYFSAGLNANNTSQNIRIQARLGPDTRIGSRDAIRHAIRDLILPSRAGEPDRSIFLPDPDYAPSPSTYGVQHF